MASILLLASLGLSVALPQGPPGSPHAPTWGPPSGWNNPHWHSGPPPAGRNGALYFLDNSPDGSSVVAMSMSMNGMPDNPMRTSTGGMGAFGINGTTGTAEPMDTLSSQDSVVVDGEYLFTVNAGSNTMVVFRIDQHNPTHLEMLGMPADVVHEFPMSVTYSRELNTACVLCGGAKAGVTCFKVDPMHGLMHPQVLGFDPAFNETTPPNGPPNTASQIIFKPDSSALVALTKGNPGAMPAQPGDIMIWPVENGAIAQKPTINHVKDILLEFGSVWVDDDRLFITDPSFGAAIVTITGTSVSETAHITIADQSAICWSTYDEQTGNAYAIDAGKNMITVVDAKSGQKTGTIMVSLSETAQMPGLFDSVIAGGKMYSLAAASGIVVTDMEKQGDFQYVDLSHLGSRQGWTGMAAYGC